MSKWLQSGRRRDICVLLAAAAPSSEPDDNEVDDTDGTDTRGELRGQQLKSQLESHYDDRIEPKSFYGTLSALVDAGFVEKRTEGLHDVYALTEAGERRLYDHYEWMGACLDADD
ncbi:PadR family transcription regulator [Natrialba magadii ATCC 43099]|uniref:PadR family transcription regulator n=1 Tax=Natrialba magadii (strain ATCC 43099 / DSM 3394 / CCM 3739 / CIP 104546 / IAM 13178 / JCM 8861 / NBRC 102185 / NCIMB 2190 / MS3) TaxID=547559 RepID=D3SWY6_NATMM|nr:PadR family transcriptional regulator [Natrialba magadii]ADD05868.1 PadR family transcription regulator [Natrialba magadii ATCC 43099]ELY30624.1 PadR family transcriptional regulator [Natrialba magadii ATCC 43099]